MEPQERKEQVESWYSLAIFSTKKYILNILGISNKFILKVEFTNRKTYSNWRLLTANSIISIAMIIRIIFFLFKINPKIPIKNSNNDRFIVMVMYL